MPDRDDAKILLGVIVVSVGVLWAATVVGLSVYIVRFIGGL